MRYISVLIGILVADVFAPRPCVAQGVAQPAPEALRERARKLADKGLGSFRRGNYAEAVALFREADQAFSAPTIQLMIARCYTKLGRLLDALWVYGLITSEEYAHYAPPQFAEAQWDAQKERAALLQRIPTVRIDVTGPPAGSVRVLIDEVRVNHTRPILRNPGTYTVIVSAAGYRSSVHTVYLAEGDSEVRTVHLSPLPRATLGSREAAASRQGAAGGPNMVFVGGGVALTTVLAGVGLGLAVSSIHQAEDGESRAAKRDQRRAAAILSFAAAGMTGLGTLVFTIDRSMSRPRPAVGLGGRF